MIDYYVSHASPSQMTLCTFDEAPVLDAIEHSNEVSGGFRKKSFFEKEV